MRKINIKFFVTRLLGSSVAPLFTILCFNSSGYGHGISHQPTADTIAPRTISKTIITVKDIEDGSYLDSAFVVVGLQKGYTDKNGVIEFENVKAGYIALISKKGYNPLSGKVKPILVFRLSKYDRPADIATVHNGLYERPLEHFSGAATVISGNDLRKINPQNFTEGIKFFDPSFIVTPDNNYGDGPNHKPDIKIRGTYNFPVAATISSYPQANPNGYQIHPSAGDFIADNIANPNQPIVFLDGAQVALQTALDIDINRIEKVTILKDAAATAAYGVRGGNGILLIQTSKPQKGKLRVNYSGQVQVSQADLSSYNLMDASGKLQLENAAGVYANNPDLYQARLERVNKGVNTDWLKVPLRTSTGSKHSLSLGGGDEDIRFGLDFSYNDMQGVMKGEKRQNTAVGGFISSRFKTFTLNNSLNYLSSVAAHSPFGNFQDYTLQNPYWAPFDSVTGKMNKVLEVFTNQDSMYTIYNPAYNGVISTKNENVYTKLSNSTSFNWVLRNGFRLNGLVAISKQSDEQNFFLPPGHTSFAAYLPNDFFKRGKYEQTKNDFLSLEGRLQLNYAKKFGFHQVYATVGASVLQSQSEAAAIVVSGFTSDKFTNLAFGNAYSNERPSTGKINTRLASGFGNFTYSFDNRYQLEVSGNADASSQFGANNRIAPHWAAGASWNLHQERFFHANKFLDQLRLRASVGTTGNQFYQSYLERSLYNYYTDKQYIPSGSNMTTRGIGLGAFLTGYGNDNLKAPTTWKQNAGIDLVLKNRLAIRVDVYHQKTTDIVLPIVSPAYTGFQSFAYYDNLGGIENKGVEFALNYNIIRNLKKGITWSVSFNGIHNEDRITSTSSYVDQFNEMNNSMQIDQIDQTRPQSKFVVGQSPTAIWAVNSWGLNAANGQEVSLTAAGTPTDAWHSNNKIVWGDLSPQWLGSFGTSFSLKNISADVYFNYRFKGEYYNQTRADKIENANLVYNVDRRAASSRWNQAGDEAFYKPLAVNGMLSSPTYSTIRFIETEKSMKCSAVSLGYALPQNIVGKLRAEQVKLGLTANNVFDAGKRNDEQGIYYPLYRMYTFSLSTTF